MENKELSAEVKKRMEDFHAELIELVKKYKLDMIPALKYTPEGIIPVINISEAKEEEKVVEPLTK